MHPDSFAAAQQEQPPALSRPIGTHMNNHNGTPAPWLAIAPALAHPDLRHHLAGLRRLLLHPQGLLGRLARHRRRPFLRARQERHGRSRCHLPRRLRRGPVHGVFADRFGTRVVVLGGLLTRHWPRWPWALSPPCRSSPPAWWSRDWRSPPAGRAVQEHRQFLRHPRTRSRARPVEHLLRLRRAGCRALFAGWCAYRLTHDWRMAFLAPPAGVVLRWPCCSSSPAQYRLGHHFAARLSRCAPADAPGDHSAPCRGTQSPRASSCLLPAQMRHALRSCSDLMIILRTHAGDRQRSPQPSIRFRRSGRRAGQADRIGWPRTKLFGAHLRPLRAQPGG